MGRVFLKLKNGFELLYLEKINTNNKANTNAATMTAAVKARSSAAFWDFEALGFGFLGFFDFDILKKGIDERDNGTNLLNFP
jgi:hypothetical protein